MSGGRASQAGFTLVEAVVAMALLALIIADVGMVSVHATRSTSVAQRLGGAVSLAEAAIEHVRSADFNRIRLPDSALALCLNAARSTVSCGDPTAQVVRECFTTLFAPVACAATDVYFTREREVTTPGGVALSDALSAQVDVLVNWVDLRAGAQQFRLTSIVSRY